MFDKLSEEKKQQIKTQLGSAARKVILMVGAWLLAKSGIDITPYIAPFLDYDNAWIGGIILVGLGWLWSSRKHLKWNRKVEIGRLTPKVVSRATIEKAADAKAEVKEIVADLKAA